MNRFAWSIISLVASGCLFLEPSLPSRGGPEARDAGLDGTPQSPSVPSNPCGGSAYACADGLFKAWNGNTGGRCEWGGDASTLDACTKTNYLIQNTPHPCSGCDWIRLYWGSGYTGAYFCIPPGYTYGQPTSPDLRFDHGPELPGYGKSIWYNAGSAKRSGPC